MSEYKPSSILPGATEIPSAAANSRGGSYADDSDGRSTGFNHNKPGVVVVDPGEPDSFTVDLSKVSKETIQKAARSAANGTDFFKAIASQPKQKQSRKPKASKVAKEAIPAQDSLWEDYEQYEDATVETSKTASSTTVTKAIAEAFEKLHIPFLTDDVPSKPGFTVYFEFHQFGTLSSKYHQVIDAPLCLVLVFDTRFEYGQQYLPPTLDVNQLITVGVHETNVKYQVASIGLSWTMGCLDFVLLIKA